MLDKLGSGENMKRIWLIILLVTLWIYLPAKVIRGKVVSIKDGDTIEVLAGKTPYRIRLEGIDSPEKKQAFGMKAKAYCSSLAFGKEVKVQISTKDRYKRHIAYVFLPDGKNLNYEMLRAGYAWHYKQYSKDKRMAELEIAARKHKLGLWSDPRAIPPWQFRKMKKTKAK